MHEHEPPFVTTCCIYNGCTEWVDTNWLTNIYKEKLEALVAKSASGTISRKSMSLSKAILIWFTARESPGIGFTVRPSASSIKWITMIAISAFSRSTNIYLLWLSITLFALYSITLFALITPIAKINPPKTLKMTSAKSQSYRNYPKF